MNLPIEFLVFQLIFLLRLKYSLYEECVVYRLSLKVQFTFSFKYVPFAPPRESTVWINIIKVQSSFVVG